MAKCLIGLLATVATLAAQGVITTIAGSDPIPPVGNISAGSIYLPGSGALVADGKTGHVYVADFAAQVIYRINPDSTVNVAAGTGICAYSGDGGPARLASICNPLGLALDSDGSLYIADSGSHAIRKVSPDGIITTFAGGRVGTPVDNVSSLSEQFAGPSGVAVGRYGRVYVADKNRVLVIQAGVVRFFAGTGTYDGYKGDGGPALQASLDPAGLAVDTTGNLLIADNGGSAIRKVDAGGLISSLAGSPDVYKPTSVTVTNEGLVCYTEYAYSHVHCVRPDGSLGLLAGNDQPGFAGNGGPAAQAQVSFPSAVAYDGFGSVYISDTGNRAVRLVSGSNIFTVALTPEPSPDPQPALSTIIGLPVYLAASASGSLYFTDGDFDIIRLFNPTGTVETLARGGRPVFTGVAVDSQGNFYVNSYSLNKVFRISPSANVTLLAGNGALASSGDNGPALQASIEAPEGLAIDPQGNLYIAEDSRVRKVSVDGTITTYAGNGKRTGDGEGIKATDASITPDSLAWWNGNLYIVDVGARETERAQPFGDRIRVVTPDGIIRTIAGNGQVGPSVSSGKQATTVALGSILGLAVDPNGLVYFSESPNRVRMVKADGTVQTVAGSSLGFSGDGGPAFAGATGAALNDPRGLAFDAAANLYIADGRNHRIRKVLAQPPTFGIDKSTLAFTANADGALAESQAVTVTASIPGVAFSVASSATWLEASISQGATPCQVSITADPAGLTAGQYSGTLTFTSSTGQPGSLSVAVSLVVSPGQPARLQIDQDSVAFAVGKSGGQQQQAVAVSNAGTGSFDFTATATTRTGANWLGITPSSGTVTARQPAMLTFSANVQGLGPGTYSGQVAIDGGPAGNALVQVVLTVSSSDQILQLSQTGLSFVAVSGGGLAPSQSFGIKNLGFGPLPWTISPVTTDGANWLSATPSSGTSVAGSASPTAAVSVDHRNLAPKQYYGLARVNAAGAANSPQAVTIHLDVLSPGSDPGAVIQPAELVFTGPAGEAPGAMEVLIYNLTGSPVSFRAASNLPNKTGTAGSILFLPNDGTIQPNVPFRLLVQPNAGPEVISKATLTFQFSNGKVSSVPLRIELAASAAQSAARRGQGFATTASNCAPSKLIPSISVVGQSFSNVPAGWPSGLSVDVLDDCQRPITAGTVVVRFSNGDPPLSLISNGDGRWQGTWAVQHPAPSITLNVTATDSQTNVTGTAQGTAGLQTSYDPPVTTQQGIVSTANPVANQPLTPGGVISIYGQRLSSSPSPLSAAAGTLPATLGDTTVLMGGRPVPLFYASENQLNGVVPWDLPADTRQQLIVSRGVTLSDPISVTVAQAQPAFFLYPQPDAPHQGLFVVLRPAPYSQGSFLNTPSAPATAGDTLVIYSLGLGFVSNQPGTGSPSPTNPLSETTERPVLHVGGRAVDVFFAGLSPGFVGLYQVQATLPAGVPTGATVPVTLEIKGQLSSPVTIAIQ